MPSLQDVMSPPLVLGLLLVVAAVILLHAGAVEGRGGVKGGIKGGPGEDDGCTPVTDPTGAAGAGVPVQMGDNSDGNRKDEDDDRARVRARSNQPAPVVCFIRANGFERRGVRRYSLRSLPIHKCTHFIYSYVETDNKSGEILYRKRGHLGEKTILRELGRIRHDTSAKDIRTLVSYGAGAHVQSLLNRIRDDKGADELVRRIKSMLETFGLDGINFHLEGPGPLVCKQEDIMTILKFIKVTACSTIRQLSAKLQRHELSRIAMDCSGPRYPFGVPN
ncbi:hypothetical protein HPB49_006084 [Dermacentor silvarum]|uniref:Uncharacterized protein n=1 Tax=Dermacentor silvarum TaxID=543639 RepID=A0ACB8DAR5_DERSI|nr:hypothetical protein HPB49_006084 [Dermacentor silvarum]